jgi:hypothetical protein
VEVAFSSPESPVEDRSEEQNRARVACSASLVHQVWYSVLLYGNQFFESGSVGAVVCLTVTSVGAPDPYVLSLPNPDPSLFVRFRIRLSSSKKSSVPDP